MTGLGIVCPIGTSLEAVGRHLQSDAPADRAGVTARPVDGFLGELTAWPPDDLQRAARLCAPVAQYAIVAATHACQQAQLNLAGLDTSRIAVLVGSMLGGLPEMVRTQRLLDQGKLSRAGGMGTTKMMNSGSAVNVAAQLRLRGPVMSNSSGFATGLDNIGCGYEWVRDGVVDVVVCGATEEHCAPFLGRQFSSWELSPIGVDPDCEVSVRPFDAHREGSLLSAGSGIVVLESADHAQRRGATPLAEVCGYASGFEASAAPDQFATALTRTIEQVCGQAAAAGAGSLTQVISGAAGFRQADAQHALAIRDALGTTALVTASAGWLGHSLAASSAWNVVLASLMLSQGVLMGCRGLQEIAPDCQGLRYVQDSRVASDPALLVTAGGLGFASSLAICRSTAAKNGSPG
ncbi:MAG: beta-ketoacyl synthase N-terminal-like domain-containing protein [Planctomycetaceae bacterium]|nr:beta-ketoacyl synthase N-terminal-like domain-containing protein [Planctomycetaceae bacterium]